MIDLDVKPKKYVCMPCNELMDYNNHTVRMHKRYPKHVRNLEKYAPLATASEYIPLSCAEKHFNRLNDQYLQLIDRNDKELHIVCKLCNDKGSTKSYSFKVPLNRIQPIDHHRDSDTHKKLVRFQTENPAVRLETVKLAQIMFEMQENMKSVDPKHRIKVIPSNSGNYAHYHCEICDKNLENFNYTIQHLGNFDHKNKIKNANGYTQSDFSYRLVELFLASMLFLTF